MILLPIRKNIYINYDYTNDEPSPFVPFDYNHIIEVPLPVRVSDANICNLLTCYWKTSGMRIVNGRVGVFNGIDGFIKGQ